MSSTQITFFGKNGKPKQCADVRNAWRGAMAIWDILEERYLPPFKPEWAFRLGVAHEKHHRMSSQNPEDAKAIWGLWEDERLSEAERICIGSTFDWVIVQRKDVSNLLKAFREFNGETSLPDQADAIEDAFKDNDIVAVGWTQTTVSENRWRSYKYNKLSEESYPYNLKRHKEHWNLFEELAKLKTPETAQPA